jgi:Tol biopolymer transport system component
VVVSLLWAVGVAPAVAGPVTAVSGVSDAADAPVQVEAVPFPRVIQRVSVSSTGAQANRGENNGFLHSVSVDGRYVAFESVASNLVPGDTGGHGDVFVRDRVAGTTSRVSVSSTGSQANRRSEGPSMSGDGRYVAFYSYATNLVPGDTNGAEDVFVRDRVAGTTSRVSVSSTGKQANGGSGAPSVSGDGRYVAFSSVASNLVPGDPHRDLDVFVRDRVAGTTSRVSVSSTGTEANGESRRPSVSADGRYVAFDSWASNLVPGDTNGSVDMFVRDRVAGTTSRVSVSSSGTQANGESSGLYDAASVSANGRYVAFDSYATNLVPGDTNGSVEVFVRDRVAGTTSRVCVSSSGTQANGGNYQPSVSGDGRYITFYSDATNLVPGDTNATFDLFIARLR